MYGPGNVIITIPTTVRTSRTGATLPCPGLSLPAEDVYEMLFGESWMAFALSGFGEASRGLSEAEDVDGSSLVIGICDTDGCPLYEEWMTRAL